MTTRRLKFVTATNDRWSLVPFDVPLVPAARLLLGWEQWRELRDTWPARLGVGVAFPNDGDVEELRPDLARLALVALPFPKWTDGRAYSLARTLRVRHRYAGELRATGDVIADMCAQLRRTGFDSVVLRPGESIAVAERMLDVVPEFYQADAQQPRLRFARQGACA